MHNPLLYVWKLSCCELLWVLLQLIQFHVGTCSKVQTGLCSAFSCTRHRSRRSASVCAHSGAVSPFSSAVHQPIRVTANESSAFILQFLSVQRLSISFILHRPATWALNTTWLSVLFLFIIYSSFFFLSWAFPVTSPFLIQIIEFWWGNYFLLTEHFCQKPGNHACKLKWYQHASYDSWYCLLKIWYFLLWHSRFACVHSHTDQFLLCQHISLPIWKALKFAISSKDVFRPFLVSKAQRA